MDRLGMRFAPAATSVVFFGAHILAAELSSGFMIFVYAMALGATAGAARAVVTTMTPAYFGTANIGAIQGVLTVALVAGSSAGPFVLSAMEGWLGSYRAANLAMAIVPVVVAIFALTNRSTPVRRLS